MRVILFRHGIALDRTDPSCPPDPERPLTPEGVIKTEAAARGLLALGVKPEHVFTSPYLRARHTAEIAAEVLGAPTPEPSDALRPDAHPSEMIAFLRKRTSTTEVLCAGHEPNLSILLARLLLGRADGPIFARLKKAGAALVETNLERDSPGDLLWLLPPRTLRDLADAS